MTAPQYPYPRWFANLPHSPAEKRRAAAIQRAREHAAKEAFFGGPRPWSRDLQTLLLRAAHNCDWETVALLKKLGLDDDCSAARPTRSRRRPCSTVILDLAHHGTEEAQSGILDYFAPSIEHAFLIAKFTLSERLFNACLDLLSQHYDENRDPFRLSLLIRHHFAAQRFGLATIALKRDIALNPGRKRIPFAIPCLVLIVSHLRQGRIPKNQIPHARTFALLLGENGVRYNNKTPAEHLAHLSEARARHKRQP